MRRMGRHAAVVATARSACNGISYYAMNQWQVAPLKPPHLAALCIWEGSSDYYRELCRHGGILSDFLSSWYPRQVASVQHGVGERGARSVVTGEPVAGPRTLTDEELAKNRADIRRRGAAPAPARRLLHGAHGRSSQDIDGAAAVGGQLGRHGPASARQFRRLSARRLQAEMAGGARRHALHAFLQPTTARTLQKRFFGHFLKGEDTGWEQAAARCSLNIRHPGEKFVLRAENEWPLARTQWTKFYLQPGRELGLGTEPPERETTLDATRRPATA